MIKFRCMNCQSKIGVKDQYAGRAIKCPKCQQPNTVPQPAAAPQLSDKPLPVEPTAKPTPTPPVEEKLKLKEDDEPTPPRRPEPELKLVDDDDDVPPHAKPASPPPRNPGRAPSRPKPPATSSKPAKKDEPELVDAGFFDDDEPEPIGSFDLNDASAPEPIAEAEPDAFSALLVQADEAAVEPVTIDAPAKPKRRKAKKKSGGSAGGGNPIASALGGFFSPAQRSGSSGGPLQVTPVGWVAVGFVGVMILGFFMSWIDLPDVKKNLLGVEIKVKAVSPYNHVTEKFLLFESIDEPKGLPASVTKSERYKKAKENAESRLSKRKWMQLMCFGYLLGIVIQLFGVTGTLIHGASRSLGMGFGLCAVTAFIWMMIARNYIPILEPEFSFFIWMAIGGGIVGAILSTVAANLTPGV